MSTVKAIAIFSFLSIFSMGIVGQKVISSQEIIWYTYSQTLQLNDKWYLQAECSERHFINPTSQFQALGRIHAHRILGAGWETSAGIATSFQNPNDPNKPSATQKLTVAELRPHIELAYNQKIDKMSIDHRYRAEARYFGNSNATQTELEDGVFFSNFRCRYKIQASVPVWKLGEKQNIKLKIGDEIMINVGDKIISNFADQNRFFAGVNIDLLPNMTFEMIYINSFQQQRNEFYFNRNILHCTLSHKINLSK